MRAVLFSWLVIATHHPGEEGGAGIANPSRAAYHGKAPHQSGAECGGLTADAFLARSDAVIARPKLS